MLEHPNVLPLLGIYLLDGADSLPGAVSPWCDDGTLIDYLKAARNARTKRASGTIQHDSLGLLCREVELLSQATSGLEYLHAQNIIHGDLKGCNILVQDGVARLSDFGYSVLVAERLGSTSSHLGTLRWFAPEFMETGARRTREADIWALGCVVLEAWTLEMPYHGRTDAAVSLALSSGDLPYTYPLTMGTRLWRIAEKCWSRYPSERATLQDISAHLQDILTPLRTVADVCLRALS
ncbi:kinase-like protein [Exidia glandulosa HHB12029]|uniref:Kinase-like protein n=1 Tax=Exidia glandulosa HHB12029 TaxID=1314781 RepID=A0A165D713_EXIGL|nr:kinase-like protein [Exidia glandulosa HHB12029]